MTHPLEPLINLSARFMERSKTTLDHSETSQESLRTAAICAIAAVALMLPGIAARMTGNLTDEDLTNIGDGGQHGNR